MTEVAARIGKLMMEELVEMHREFVRYYGPDTDASPKWMEGEGLNELMSMLQKAVIEDRENDSTSLVPLYRSVTESRTCCDLHLSSRRAICVSESLRKSAYLFLTFDIGICNSKRPIKVS